MASESRRRRPEGPGRIRVLIADDHDTFRTSLSDCLRTEPDIEVVGYASNGQQAIERADALDPDVILMDISMPVMNGITATERIAMEHPRTRIVAFSMHDTAELLVRMVQAGAVEYVCKSAPISELLKAIRGSAD
jgi:two-component system nitrate/nitrite response regulator NarL